MRYLSIDIEATGLNADDEIIEFAAVPFCTESNEIAEKLAYCTYVKCREPLEKMRHRLDPWVIDHNSELINRAYETGIDLSQLKHQLKNYLDSAAIRNYFQHNFEPIGPKPVECKIVLFGKSLSAIDLPFLTRDLGKEFFDHYFKHRQLDLSGLAYGLMDFKLLPPKMDSGENLMRYLGQGEVGHRALDDAIYTAKMYLELLRRFQLGTLRA